eukprot:GHVP01018813.1.p1 GENE.GHVP01018813.1~~GHVP01018813.1.p1  ORF type:complete len:160 (+),score=29.94 GHVP01018813.1:129-608(+)
MDDQSSCNEQVELFIRSLKDEESRMPEKLELIGIKHVLIDINTDIDFPIPTAGKRGSTWKGSKTQEYLLTHMEDKRDVEVESKIILFISQISGISRGEILEKTQKELNLFIKNLLQLFPLKEKYNEIVPFEERTTSTAVIHDSIREMIRDVASKELPSL